MEILFLLVFCFSFLRFRCFSFSLFLNFFGFDFFRSKETRLGGKDLRWFAKKIKKDSIFFFCCFSFYASDASHFFFFRTFLVLNFSDLEKQDLEVRF